MQALFINCKIPLKLKALKKIQLHLKQYLNIQDKVCSNQRNHYDNLAYLIYKHKIEWVIM